MSAEPLFRHDPITDTGLKPSQRFLQLWQSVVASIGTGGGSVATGSGGTLDMGDRMTGADFYDGGTRV